jgi:hypothetical protein
MVSTLTYTSTSERLRDQLIEYFKARTDYRYVPDVDFGSQEIKVSEVYKDPVFNLNLQELNRERGLPIVKIRLYIYSAIHRSVGSSIPLQDNLCERSKDEFVKLLMSREGAKRLNMREARIINSNPQRRGDLYILLTQVEFKAFQRNGEYKK